MRFLDWMLTWPRWGWWVAVTVYALVFAVFLAGVYAWVNGPFVEPLLWALVGVPACWARLWWYERGKRKAAQ